MQISIIENADVNFIVEELPPELNMLDYARFKRMYKNTISGHVISDYCASNYIVFAYTDLVPTSKKVCCVLFETIALLKQLLISSTATEIWVIHDQSYTCVGMLDGRPIFIRIFNDIYTADMNLSMMLKSMHHYSTASCAQFRLFGCEVEDFEYQFQNVWECKAMVIENITGGIHLRNFCINNFNQGSKISKYLTYPVYAYAFAALYVCLMIYFNNVMQVKMQRDLETIATLQKQGLISAQHYQKILDLKNSRPEEF